MQSVKRTPAVVVLAGGRGERLNHLTDDIPKPLIEIGGRPILWHILDLYAAAGVRRGLVAVGYRGDQIKQAFSKSRTVQVIDTGLSANTAGRLRRLASYLPDDNFCLTYCDGVSDVNIGALVEFHLSHRKIATVTAVHPPAPFGLLTLDDDKITHFAEKAPFPELWINGGFMVFRRDVFDWIHADSVSLEYDVLSKLAEIDELMAFRHTGFWHCMDTASDVERLNSLWDHGRAPWRIW